MSSFLFVDIEEHVVPNISDFRCMRMAQYKINGISQRYVERDIQTSVCRHLSLIDGASLTFAKMSKGSLMDDDMQLALKDIVLSIFDRVLGSCRVINFYRIGSDESEDVRDLFETVKVEISCDNYIFIVVVECTGEVANVLSCRFENYDSSRPISSYIRLEDIQVEIQHIET
jgi:hypothetical protein